MKLLKINKFKAEEKIYNFKMFWDLIFSSYLEKVKIENNKKGNILWSIS